MQKKNTKNHFLNKHRYLLVGILCLFGICLLTEKDGDAGKEEDARRFVVRR